MTRRRDVPVRTCVGCGTRDAQSAMIRLRIDADGGLLALVGRADGRSAYVHRRAACVQGLVKSRGLGRSLRATIGREPRLALVEALVRRPDVDPPGAATV